MRSTRSSGDPTPADRRGAAFQAEIGAIPKTIDRVVVEGAITRETSSLVQPIDAAGENIELSLRWPRCFRAR
jgi:hypothetical protein